MPNRGIIQRCITSIQEFFNFSANAAPDVTDPDLQENKVRLPNWVNKVRVRKDPQTDYYR